jgi:hypothetical protein
MFFLHLIICLCIHATNIYCQTFLYPSLDWMGKNLYLQRPTYLSSSFSLESANEINWESGRRGEIIIL